MSISTKKRRSHTHRHLLKLQQPEEVRRPRTLPATFSGSFPLFCVYEGFPYQYIGEILFLTPAPAESIPDISSPEIGQSQLSTNIKVNIIFASTHEILPRHQKNHKPHSTYDKIFKFKIIFYLERRRRRRMSGGI